MAEWMAGDVLSNGIRIHYHRTGGDKRPLVLAHGITDSGLCWSPVARALEGSYDLIMYDARGHGLSEIPRQGNYSYPTLAADLAGLIEALGLERPCLMGHSLGAVTVATLAADCPELASCAVLEDPPWRPETVSWPEEREAHYRRWRASLEAQQTMTREELIAACHQQSPSWSEAELGPWAESKLLVSPDVLQIVRLVGRPWGDILPTITCPTLLITADPERGAAVTPAVAEQAARLLRHGRVVCLGGAGHNIRREQFDAYMNTVKAFLAEFA